jgi:hypothetical protein
MGMIDNPLFAFFAIPAVLAFLYYCFTQTKPTVLNRYVIPGVVIDGILCWKFWQQDDAFWLFIFGIFIPVVIGFTLLVAWANSLT